MRSAVVIVAMALGGCRSLIGIDDPVIASDAPIDQESDAIPADARDCFGVAPFELCTKAPARTRFDVLTALTLDTSTTCDTIVRGWCVVIANEVSISAQLKVIGARPFALLALTTMTVTNTGVISADGTSNSAGPGADAATCNAGVAATPGNNGGGGGAGGSFATSGGRGGDGNGGATSGATAGVIVLAIDDLRGGCRGSVGGQGGGSSSANPAGAGGGGLYLLAGEALTVAGKLDASGGGGGRGNASKSGGSGGGSGGMIVLWSPMITGTPTMIANGGGGGGGADTGANGTPGSECISTAPANGGPGGGPLVGAGGKGSSGTGMGLPGTDDLTGAGGGGGGGGGGVIRIFGGNQLVPGPSISPPAS